MSSLQGVTYPKGFRASGVACGLKKNGNPDLGLVVCDHPATAFGMFTRNVVKGHSLQLARDNVANGQAQAVVVNAGCANACMGETGRQDALTFARLTAEAVCCVPEDVLPGSTGVIGMPMEMDKIAAGVKAAAAALSREGGPEAAAAIMTTDTHPKMAQTSLTLGGREVRIGAMAKGSGMIHVNLATMISVITTDAALTPAACRKVLRQVVGRTYNHVSVDGDTSVCDKVLLLASGDSGAPVLDEHSPELPLLEQALEDVATEIARMLAADGEGATKLLTILVKGAPTQADATAIAQAIAKSPLCKTAAYGRDANWGRPMTAAGYSGAQFDPELADFYIGDLQVCKAGGALAFDEARAVEILSQSEVVYTLDLHQGEGQDFMWTCDLTHEYVTINGSYRS